MRLKSELYKIEQDEIINKIIDILKLDTENSITLYELDNNKDKQEKIMKLMPIIRKYFRFSSIGGARKPKQLKRPYLSIIKYMMKINHKIYNIECRITVNNKIIRTIKYIFLKK